VQQLQHPLAQLETTAEGVVLTPLSEKVPLARTCTPRDTFMLSSSTMVGVDCDNTEMHSSNGIDELDTSTTADIKKMNLSAESRSLHRIRSFPINWGASKAKSSVSRKSCALMDDTNVSNHEELKTTYTAALQPQRSSPMRLESTKAPRVTFNESMEVRYFYRSDYEIEIMKQCAIERRQQHEARRRLRRRLHKGPSTLPFQSDGHNAVGFSSTNIKNMFVSFIGSNWTTCQEENDTIDDVITIFHNAPNPGEHDRGSSTNGDEKRTNEKSHDEEIFNSEHHSAEIAVATVFSGSHTASTGFLYDLMNGFSFMMNKEMINDVSTGKVQDDSKGETISETETISAARVIVEPDKVIQETVDETTEQPWILTALTCGNGLKLN
jgi:hypothetical protein